MTTEKSKSNTAPRKELSESGAQDEATKIKVKASPKTTSSLNKEKVKITLPVKQRKSKQEFDLDVKEMAKAGLHLGHRTSRLYPTMKPYICGIRNTIHIIDLEKTKQKSLFLQVPLSVSTSLFSKSIPLKSSASMSCISIFDFIFSFLLTFIIFFTIYTTKIPPISGLLLRRIFLRLFYTSGTSRTCCLRTTLYVLP